MLQDFFAKLDNRSYGATGFFAPRPIYDQRQAFILYSAAQLDVDAAEQLLATADGFGYQQYKIKYDRSRATVTRTGEFLSKPEESAPAGSLQYHAAFPVHSQLFVKSGVLIVELSCHL